jgi:hypothetical protein
MNTNLLIGGVAAVSFSAGAGISYLLTKRVMTTRFEEIITQELADAKKYYEARQPTKKPATPGDELLKRGYHDQVRAYREFQVDTTIDAPEKSEPEEEDWDWVTELAGRNEDEPYVIHHDEFTADQPEYDKVCLTYYEKDDVVLDDRVTPLPDVDLIIGNANLQRFGHGSKKKDVVFIRNEHLETDWEVTRKLGDYAEEVLGFIQHDDGPGKVLKFHRERE